MPDPYELQRVASAVSQEGMDNCVITIETCDNIPDGEADYIIDTSEKVREKFPGIGV